MAGPMSMTNIAEPTPEMIEAGYAIMSQTPSEAGCDYKTQLGRAYTAMRSSAPQEPDDAVVFLREKARQRPSPGLIERQGITEDAIRYGQALLNAAADSIEENVKWHDDPIINALAEQIANGELESQQEPVADDDAEWLRSTASLLESLPGIHPERLARMRIIANRLQAKAPETGEE